MSAGEVAPEQSISEQNPVPPSFGLPIHGSNMTNEKNLAQRLDALAGFLPIFADPNFSFGSWSEMERVDDDTFIMPFFSLSPKASDFVEMTYREGWILKFNWGDWKQTKEAAMLRDDPTCLAAATPDQLAKLLTVCVRQDRFSEGALESFFESGLLTGIVRRAAVLLAAIDDQSRGNQTETAQ